MEEAAPEVYVTTTPSPKTCLEEDEEGKAEEGEERAEEEEERCVEPDVEVKVSPSAELEPVWLACPVEVGAINVPL